ncbi:MAG: methyl-accepting chemotaxis protein [Pyrinomonadaceae bacterium]
MARRTANSLFNSLKNKIWLATSALAFFICSFGLVSYLIVASLTEDTFYAVFILFTVMALSVMIFGWWLSNELISPIEKVSLLAKSLERGVTTSLPRTTGSTETDEILQTLHRSNQQLQNLVGLMDRVANGELQVALTPLENSDRLTGAFQKLLAKVTDSIQAKQDLEKLQTAVANITKEIAPIRTGNFDVEIKTDSEEVKEISETFKYTIGQMNNLISQIKSDSEQAQNSAVGIYKTLQNIVHADETRLLELNQAKLTLKQLPKSVQKIAETLENSAQTANNSIEKAQRGTLAAQENLNAAAALRKQIQEAVSRVGRLNERSQEIGKIAKAVDDFSQRCGLIALNASIQADKLGEKGRGFALIAEEIEQLTVRANNTNKQISLLNKTVFAEIAQVESCLDSTVGGVANLSKFAIETGNALSELERYIGQFLNLQTQLVGYSSEQSAETEKAFQIFIDSIYETEKTVETLKKSEAELTGSAGVLENLQLSVAGFTSAKVITDITGIISEQVDFAEPVEQNFSV